MIQVRVGAFLRYLCPYISIKKPCLQYPYSFLIAKRLLIEVFGIAIQKELTSLTAAVNQILELNKGGASWQST